LARLAIRLSGWPGFGKQEKAMNNVALGDMRNVTSGGLPGSVIAVFVSVGIVADVVGWSPRVRASEAVGGEQAEGNRPNVLIMMTDHGRADVVTAGSQCLTSNLDRLATEGVRFGRCYTPDGMCSPARASLMTATYPSTHGVWDCTHTQREAWVDIAPELVHWAQRLSAAGYRTGYFGKWKLTQSDKLEDNSATTQPRLSCD
jgi:hypothetical protein